MPFEHGRRSLLEIRRASSGTTIGFIGGRLALVTTPSDDPKGLPGTHPVLPREPVQRWRLLLARDAAGSRLVQREQQAAWEEALAGSGLPVAGLDAARPRPRFAVAAPLGGAIRGEAELVDLWLVERLPVWRVRETLVGRLPAGWHLLDLYDVWLGEPPLPGQVVASRYRATLDAQAADPAALASAASELLAAATLPRERQKGERIVAYDLRPLLADLQVVPSTGAPDRLEVRMTLRHDPERGVGRPDEAMDALAELAGVGLVPIALVREGLELADRSLKEAAPVRRAAPARRPQGQGGRPPA